MKILLVILRCQAFRGGAESYTVTLFQKLLAAGHDVSMAAATFDDAIPVERRIVLPHRGLSRARRYTRFIKSLQAHLRSAKYDIVHAMLPAPCNVYHPHAGLEFANYRGASIWRRMFNERQWLFTRTERTMMTSPRPPITLCLSDRARLDAEATYPQAKDRLVTLYTGVDDEQFEELDEAMNAGEPPTPPHSAPLVLFIGHDFARKGLDVAIRAVASHPNAILIVHGRDQQEPYRALASKLGITDRVKFQGTGRSIATALANAHLLLLPARREPFGMVAVEAMLMGVPPIVSSVSGVAEILHDGVDGRIITGEDPAAWTSAIMDVMTNRDRYAAACRARRQELSYENHLKKLTEIYERVAAETRA